MKPILKDAPRTTWMTTRYDITDGPIVPSLTDHNSKIRVTHVEVTVFSTGYRQVDVKGKSVTKAGKDKSRYDYFHADRETTDAIINELEAM